MALRPSIRHYENNPDQLTALRQAYARLKSLPDERGFDFFAALHGLSLPVWCEHGSPLFLPWHRAYLYYFELALQTRLGARFSEVPPQVPEFGDLGLPWWDWSSAASHATGIPQSYSQATAGGQPNPLARTEVGACGSQTFYTSGVWSGQLLAAVRAQIPGALAPNGAPVTLRDPEDPDDLPTRATVDNIILQQPTYLTFNTSLEQAHNDVHVWVGGAMSSVPTAAYDPIFWAHHAMCDRLWYVWQNSPLGVDPPPDLMDTILAPFPLTVAQVLDIDRLNYDYAVTVTS